MGVIPTVVCLWFNNAVVENSIICEGAAQKWLRDHPYKQRASQQRNVNYRRLILGINFEKIHGKGLKGVLMSSQFTFRNDIVNINWSIN
jgi:hypothetical protein